MAAAGAVQGGAPAQPAPACLSGNCTPSSPAVLRLVPGDVDTLRCKVALHIELGNFEEALSLASLPAIEAGLGFERAYCLYRQGKLPEALDALTQVGPDRQVARVQLEAQLQYRLGNYPKAIELYTSLLQQQGPGSAGQEVQANAVAAQVAGGRGAELPAFLQTLKVRSRALRQTLCNSEGSFTGCCARGAAMVPACDFGACLLAGWPCPPYPATPPPSLRPADQPQGQLRGGLQCGLRADRGRLAGPGP